MQTLTSEAGDVEQSEEEFTSSSQEEEEDFTSSSHATLSSLFRIDPKPQTVEKLQLLWSQFCQDSHNKGQKQTKLQLFAAETAFRRSRRYPFRYSPHAKAAVSPFAMLRCLEDALH